MAVINTFNSGFISSGMAMLGGHGSMGFGGATGQQYQNWNPYGNQQAQNQLGLSMLAQIAAQTAMQEPNVKPQKQSETIDQNEGPHKYLQRRVNKWLRGVQLPLH